ncbi:MAG: class I tRNA ligase family protein, partial [Chitinophagaceae bacterium]
LQLLHPFMPFVTEEIYHQLCPREQGDDLMIKRLEEVKPFNAKVLEQGQQARQVITAIRDTRNTHQLKNKDIISLRVYTEQPEIYKRFEAILLKQINADHLYFTNQEFDHSIAIVVNKDKFFIRIPQNTNHNLQKDKLLQDLQHQKGFLDSVEKKLSNERFVQNANPELVENERKKQTDAKARIQAIEESLKSL